MLPLRYLRLVIVLAGLVAVFLAVPAPAPASVSGSTSTADLTLYDQCQLHPVDYSIQVTPDTTYWELHVQLFDPRGLTYTQVVFTKTTSATHGTAQFQFCGAETPGTWTVHGEGFYEILPGAQIPYTLPDSSFQVRQAQTRTGLRSRGLGRGRYRLTVTVVDQRPDGFGRTEGATVQLQRLLHGVWAAIHGTRTQADRGRVNLRVHARRRTPVRAVTMANGNYAGSVSRTVRLR